MTMPYGSGQNSLSSVPTYGRADERLDARELLRIVRRRRGLLIGTIAAVSAIAAGIAFGMTPQYTGNALLMISQSDTYVIDGEGVVEQVEQNTQTLETHVKWLQSRSFVEQLATVEELGADPEFNLALERPDAVAGGPQLAWLSANLPAWTARVAPVLSSWLPESWLIASGLATPAAPPEVAAEAAAAPTPTADSVDLDRIVEEVRGQLHAARAGEGTAVTISFSSEDPVKAARLANQAAALYVEEQATVKRRAVARATEWLKQGIEELRGELARSEQAVAAYRSENELLGAHGVSLDVARLAAIHTELLKVRAERAANEAKLDLLLTLRRSGQGFEAVQDVNNSPTIAALRNQQTALLRQEAQLRQEFGARHPTILQLEAEKLELQAKFTQEVANIIGAFEGEVAALRNREKSLQANLDDAKTVVAGSESAEVQLRALEREATANQDLFQAMLDRFKKLNEQVDVLQPGVAVISTAAPPNQPSFPQPRLILAVGFTSSVLIASLLAFMAESLDHGLRTSKQIERVLGVRCIGSVPQIPKLKGKRRAHHHLIAKPRSAYAEALRSVQTALQFSSPDRPAQTILITSSLPGEGKTTFALSLGVSLATTGHKTVVIDMDLRHPSIRRELDQTLPKPGLIELVDGTATLDDVLQRQPEVPNLDVITVQRNPVNPIDLLASKQISMLLAQLRARYKYVVIDAPPVLGINDAKIALHLADAVLFVVRWGKTKVDVATNGMEALRECRAPIAGSVMTQIDLRRHARGAYGDAAEHYGKYKHYYLE